MLISFLKLKTILQYDFLFFLSFFVAFQDDLR